MATLSRIDGLLDDAQLAREDGLGVVLDAQHALHNAMTALRAAWDKIGEAEKILAGSDERDEPGPIFLSLAAIRECPSWRRAVAVEWDGETERREGGLVAL